ncbi:unnamed protein product [marine sediment metagenome]|uniref:Four helix bundle protein n=1 Tax=marine sediment metagenome TaxID=412755 RepID=X0TC28_9ZZZZ
MDSVFSISSNIAEGYCRRSIKEYIQFTNIALGSVGENYSQFYALYRSKEIPKDIFDEYDQRHYSLENKLLNLARSLTKKVKEKGQWDTEYMVREPEIEVRETDYTD